MSDPYWPTGEPARVTARRIVELQSNRPACIAAMERESKENPAWPLVRAHLVIAREWSEFRRGSRV